MVRGGDKQAARKSSLRKSGSRTLREARKPLPSPAHPTCPSPKPSPQPLPTTTSSHRAPPANTGPGPPSLRSSQIRTPLEARRRLGSKMTRWRLRRDQAPGEGTQAKLLGEALSTAGRGHAGPPEGWAGEGGVSPGLTPLLGTGQWKELDFDLREKFIRFDQILGISLDHIPFLPQTGRSRPGGRGVGSRDHTDAGKVAQSPAGQSLGPGGSVRRGGGAWCPNDTT
ncbi:proline-rich protein 31-like isoform X1 [Symphalangus syndactylus]|uniref:proline-rich protein 31-like isoform X1 n=1 Tax=Symphalangus syndactylus TaxID=9590 RepID=UPI003005A90A